MVDAIQYTMVLNQKWVGNYDILCVAEIDEIDVKTAVILGCKISNFISTQETVKDPTAPVTVHTIAHETGGGAKSKCPSNNSNDYTISNYLIIIVSPSAMNAVHAQFGVFYEISF